MGKRVNKELDGDVGTDRHKANSISSVSNVKCSRSAACPDGVITMMDDRNPHPFLSSPNLPPPPEVMNVSHHHMRNHKYTLGVLEFGIVFVSVICKGLILVLDWEGGAVLWGGGGFVEYI